LNEKFYGKAVAHWQIAHIPGPGLTRLSDKRIFPRRSENNKGNHLVTGGKLE
jgi:hypothetical protein